MPNFNKKGGRRRSSSESDGDLLNSTVNPPPDNSNTNASNIDRCVSNPHINTTGFIDDSYRNSIGTRFETRVLTRLQTRGGNSERNNHLRDEFTKMRGLVYEWVHILSSSVQPTDVIDNKHNLLCTEIDHLISEILLTRGDYALVGEFGSLKDKLDAARKDAKIAARERSIPIPTSTPRAELPTIQSNHSKNSNHDNTFEDENNMRGETRGNSSLDLSIILEPPDNASSSTVVDQDMGFNNILGSNPSRQLNSSKPNLNPLPPPVSTVVDQGMGFSNILGSNPSRQLNSSNTNSNPPPSPPLLITLLLILGGV